MSIANRWRIRWSRVRALVTRSRGESDLSEEVQAHLDLLVDEHLRRGLTLDQARAAARRDFGGVEAMKETWRDQRGVPMVETFVRDVRYGLRALRRNPAFTIVAIASIALGIGVNCAVFTILNAALLKKLPVADPDRLIALNGFRRDARLDISYPVFRDIEKRQRTLTGLAASAGIAVPHVRLEGVTDEVDDPIDGAAVSANYFTLLGVSAAHGRVFTLDDSPAPREGAVAVISDGFWQRQFGGDPTILGRTILLNGTPFAIIGIAPRGFFGDSVGQSRDIWIPINMQPRVEKNDMLEKRTASWFRAIGRLKPDVTAMQAAAELTVLLQQVKGEEIASGQGSLIAKDQPTDFRVEALAGSAGLNRLGNRFRRPANLLMWVVALVLLIACCNVANLMLARGATRQREMSIRLAIGSGRRRLIAQLLTESLILSTIGGALGLLFATWAARLLVTRFMIGRFDLRLDSHVLIFTIAVSLLTGIIFGIVPALQTTAVDPGATLQAASSRQSGSRSRHRISRGLIALQVGLSVWLLIGAGLVIRTMQNLRALDAGVDRLHVLSVRVLPGVGGIPPAAVPDLRRRLADRLKSIPGVANVAFSGYGLFSGSAQTSPVRVPDSSVNPERDGEVRQNYITPDYFHTVGMMLVRGRAFTDADTVSGGPRVTVINETMARHYFGQADPIGRLIYFPEIDSKNRYVPFPPVLPRAQAFEIVGVVRDAKYDNLREVAPRMTFMPLRDGLGIGSMHVRTSIEPSAIIAAIPAVLREVDQTLKVRGVTTLEAEIDRTLGEERLVTQLLGFFGILALGLACVGLYGVMAFAVTLRTGEIGIRMALGAQRSTVVAMVLRETLVLVAIGAALGIAAAAASTRMLERLLFGVTPTDPITIAGTTLLMLMVAALASAIPAKRAAAVDPLVALRYE
jgi:predicted permease